MQFSKTSLIKIFVYIMVICFLLLSFVIVWNRRYTFNLGWAKVENHYTLSDPNGENEVVVAIEIEHSHRYTYHVYTRIYSMPDINGDIYKISRLVFNASKNGLYPHKIDQLYEIPGESYYNLFLVDGVNKRDVYTIEGLMELVKFTTSANISKQLEFKLSYTFQYSLEELIYLDYALIWVEIFILIVICVLFFIVISEVKSIIKEARMPEEEREERKRYANYFKIRKEESEE